jgi:hypothetical protein
LPGWTNVKIKGLSVGFVYMKGGRWWAVMEPDGQTGKDVGTASSKREAIDLVKKAYLRT